MLQCHLGYSVKMADASFAESMANVSVDEPVTSGGTNCGIDSLSERAIKPEPLDDTAMMPSGYSVNTANAPDGGLLVQRESMADTTIEPKMAGPNNDNVDPLSERPIKTEPIDDNNTVPPGLCKYMTKVADGFLCYIKAESEVGAAVGVSRKADGDLQKPLRAIKTEPADNTAVTGVSSGLLRHGDGGHGGIKVKDERNNDVKLELQDEDLEEKSVRVGSPNSNRNCQVREKLEEVAGTSGAVGGQQVTSQIKKPYSCDLCESRFRRPSHLKVHMRSHTGEKPYSCDVCGCSFTQACRLTVHKRTHTGEKPYSCDVCEYSFSQAWHLKAHKRTHTGEKPYLCGICKSRFRLAGHLKSHMKTHTGEKPYSCDVCESRFRHACDLKAHKRTHTGEKPYLCDVCEASFSQAAHLKVHMKTHTGEKPYPCDVCEARFRHAGNLKAHMRTHTGEKPYSCDVCESRFSKSGQLKTHKRIHTVSEKGK